MGFNLPSNEKATIVSILNSLIKKTSGNEFNFESSETSFDHVVFEPSNFASIVFGSGSNLFPDFHVSDANALEVTFEIKWDDWKNKPIQIKLDTLNLTVIANNEVENVTNYSSSTVSEKNSSYGSVDRLFDSFIIIANKINIKFILNSADFSILITEFESSPCGYNFTWPSGELWSLEDSQMKGKTEVVMFRITKWKIVDLIIPTTKSTNRPDNSFKLTANRGSTNLTIRKSLVGKNLIQIKNSTSIEEAIIIIDLTRLDSNNFSSDDWFLVQKFFFSILNLEDLSTTPEVRKPNKISFRRLNKTSEQILQILNQTNVASNLKIECLQIRIIDQASLFTKSDAKSNKNELRIRMQGLEVSLSFITEKSNVNSIEERQVETEMTLLIHMDKIQMHSVEDQKNVNKEPFFIAPFIYEVDEPIKGPVIASKLVLDLQTFKLTSIMARIGPSRTSLDLPAVFFFGSLLNRLTRKFNFETEKVTKWDIEMTLPLIVAKNDKEEEKKFIIEVKAGKLILCNKLDEIMNVSAKPIWVQMIEDGKFCTLIEPIDVKIVVNFTNGISISLFTKKPLTALLQVRSSIVNLAVEFIKSLSDQVKNKWFIIFSSLSNLKINIELHSLFLYLTHEYKFEVENNFKFERQISKDQVDQVKDERKSQKGIKLVKKSSKVEMDSIVTEFNRRLGLTREVDIETSSSSSSSSQSGKQVRMSSWSLKRSSAEEAATKSVAELTLQESFISLEALGLVKMVDEVCIRSKISAKNKSLIVRLDRIHMEIHCDWPHIDFEIKSKDTIRMNDANDSADPANNQVTDHTTFNFLVSGKLKLDQTPRFLLSVDLNHPQISFNSTTINSLQPVWKHLLLLCQKSLQKRGKVKSEVEFHLDNSKIYLTTKFEAS